MKEGRRWALPKVKTDEKFVYAHNYGKACHSRPGYRQQPSLYYLVFVDQPYVRNGPRKRVWPRGVREYCINQEVKKRELLGGSRHHNRPVLNQSADTSNSNHWHWGPLRSRPTIYGRFITLNPLPTLRWGQECRACEWPTEEGLLIILMKGDFSLFQWLVLLCTTPPGSAFIVVRLDSGVSGWKTVVDSKQRSALLQ